MSDPGRIPTNPRKDVGGIGWYLVAPALGVILIIAWLVLR